MRQPQLRESRELQPLPSPEARQCAAPRYGPRSFRYGLSDDAKHDDAPRKIQNATWGLDLPQLWQSQLRKQDEVQQVRTAKTRGSAAILGVHCFPCFSPCLVWARAHSLCSFP